MTYLVFRAVRIVFNLFSRPARTYEQRDRVMALYAPVALLAIPTVSLLLIIGGFTVAFYGLDHDGWRDAFTTSGSSLLTLGFERPPSTPGVVLSFLEAAIGLGLLALVISYLPTIYGAFSRREVAVTDLSVRAGTPPKPWEMLERAHLAGYLHEMDRVWESWMTWFTELGETHTSLAVLSFFRSPNPGRSWITASGAVLDAAVAAHGSAQRRVHARGRPLHPLGLPRVAGDRGVVRVRLRHQPAPGRSDLDLA